MRNGNSSTHQENDLASLINSALSGLSDIAPKVKEYLISLAQDGSLAQQQSKGSFEGWASELLRKAREGGS
jgi:hypothetical protein